MTARPLKRQRGAAILVLLMIVSSVMAYMIVGALNQASRNSDRDRVTTEALAQAKAALISFAVSVRLDTGTARPGDLPCPAANTGGTSLATCNTQTAATNQRLGRFPWRTLGLEELRDGDGQPLWYAVSNSYKNSTRLACATPGAAGCLNSDTPGTLTLRDSTGTVISNATSGTDVVAVIIAPGAALKRQDGTNQVRAANQNLPIHYMDNVTGVEDNATFIDGSTSDGFISGPVKNAANVVIVNDRILAITRAELMAVLEPRVAREALSCFTAYATANGNRYPWAAPVTAGLAPTYVDTPNTFFGRVPDTGLQNPGAGMVNNLNTCTTSRAWFNNWKEQTFYALAGSRRPTLTAGVACGAAPNTCLTINTPTAVTNQRVAIMVAGRRLTGVAGGQPRTSAPEQRGTIANYLENQNSATRVYTQGTATATFNDRVLYSQ